MSEPETAHHRPRPVVLCVLDGWGERAERDGNAIALADTPNGDRFKADYPNAVLEASSTDVGLPEGQMGNSEVGHMNLGAGRVVIQDLPRIDAAVADGSLARNPALTGLIETLMESGGACHLMGLVSPGGVHSHMDHMAALAHIVGGAGIPVVVHAFLDGRDTPPASALEYVAHFRDDVSEVAGVTVGTVSGRYYAMDRDQRWERVEKAYRALITAEGETAPDAATAIEQSYARNATDEFVLPTVVDGFMGMADGDGLLMANFRADRVRQILTALVDADFGEFVRSRTVNFAARVGMAEYSADLNRFLDALISPPELRNILGQVIAEASLTQLRIAETEKYAHVTFFLNGGREEEFPGEERILVPSPRVATYDLAPAMSAVEVTDRLVGAIDAGSFDFIVVNYANGDMVGHTGNLTAAMQAAEAVDTCLGRLEAAVIKAGGVLLITADHGNAEMMGNADTGQAHTAHSINPVPVILVNAPVWVQGLKGGRLADVAPTILRLMDLPQPDDMTGQSLVCQEGARSAAAQ